MNKHYSSLDLILDESILVKTVFVRTDGKLRMARSNVKMEDMPSTTERPLFPISKERK